jgi:hypothetical protein
MDQPGKGWKVAYLIDPLTMKFRGLFHGQYNLESRFTCYKGHKLPELDCTCGFHTYNDYEDAYLDHLAHPGSVLLRCELYGTIVLHNYGSRSENQVINRLEYDKYCSKMYCQRKALGFGPRFHKEKDLNRKQNHYETFCLKHLNKLENKKIPTYRFTIINKIVESETISEDFLLSK